MYNEIINNIENFIIERNQPKKFTLIIDDDRVCNFHDVMRELYKSGIISKYKLKWTSENSFGNDKILLYGTYKN